jgi:DNA repair exonuclease SbcCD ATPase subunit
MEEEYPRIRSLEEGVDVLFPFLTTTERKELLDGIRRALMEVLGDDWGKREISVDEMREEMRKKLRDEIKGIETIPEDERERILDRIERLIPAEELVKLKGKIKHSLTDRIKLKESVINAFKRILEENLRGEIRSLEDIEKKLDKIREKLEEKKAEKEYQDHPMKKEVSAKEVQEKESEGLTGQDEEKIGKELDEIRSVLNEVKEELENIEESLNVTLKKAKEETEEYEGEDFESECEKKLEHNIKSELGEIRKSFQEKIDSKIDKIKSKIGEIRNKIGEKKKRIEEIKKEVNKMENQNKKALEEVIEEVENEIEKKGEGKEEGINEKINNIEKIINEIKKMRIIINEGINEKIIKRYGIKEEIEKLCEEIEKSVDISALLVEGAERIIVDNMNRMVRKDLSLFISWSLGNPLREFYYRVKRGEEI